MKFRNIYIEIINECNLSCSFCPKTSRPIRAMTLNEFEYIVGQSANLCEFVYLHVVGEPLMHPQFSKILDVCERKNIKVKLTTNGTLLEQNAQEIAIHNCIKGVNISLSCVKDFDINQAQTHLKSAFNAVKRLSKNKILCSLRVWTDTNHIKLIKDFLKSEFDFSLDTSAVGKQKIADYLFFHIENEFVWPVDSTAPPQEKNSCLGLRRQLAILCDGTVVPCCLDSEGRVPLGNVFSQPLEEIINSKRSKAIAKGFQNSQAVEPFCKTCTFFSGISHNIP